MPVLVMMLLLSAAQGREAFYNRGEMADFLSSRPIYDRFQFGTLWQVYLPVMTYDLLYSSMYIDRSSTRNTQRSLLDVTGSLPWVIADRHPCRKGKVVITGARWRGHMYFKRTYTSTHALTKDFRICGFYHVTYIPGWDKELTDPFSPSAEKSLIVYWDWMSHWSFSINLTVSEFAAPNSYRCQDSRLILNVYSADGNHTEILCPNWGAVSLIGIHFQVELILNYRRGQAVKNRSNQYLTSISFQYQILDNRNLSLKRFPQNRQAAVVQKDYTFQVDSNNDTFLELNKSPIAFLGYLPDALVYLFLVCIKRNHYITPAVLRKNVVCNDHAEVIFYDGTYILPLLPEQFQPILTIWNCTGLSDAETRNHGKEEVRGSIGELSILVFVPQVDKQKPFFLEITWQVKHILPSVLRERWVRLDLSANRTVRLIPRHGTAVEVAHIIAPKGKFVHLTFSDLTYTNSGRQSTHEIQLCNNFIRISSSMGTDNDLICSNSSAEYILSRYKKNGLTFGSHVIITLVQYWWMARISAIITASIDHCAGYINLMPTPQQMSTTMSLRTASLTFHKISMLAGNYGNNSWTFEGIVILLRRSPASCIRLQLVIFSDFAYQLIPPETYNLYRLVLQYTITSEDLTSPSRFMIDTSCLDNELHFQNISSPYMLRLFSLDSTFTPARSLTPGVWNAEAYTTEIRLHISLLAHAAGLVVQVEDGKSPPACTVERHTGVAISPEVQLPRICSHAELNMKGSVNVIIYKPYHDRHCCQLEANVVHTQSTKGFLLIGVLHNETADLPFHEIWEITEHNLNVQINVVCEYLCMGIVILIDTDLNSTHGTTLSYRASLIQKNSITPESDIRSGDWLYRCLQRACYIVRVYPEISNVTWNEAKEHCENNNWSLLSINADSEWRMVREWTQQDYILMYIGLTSKVSVNLNVEFPNEVHVT